MILSAIGLSALTIIALSVVAYPILSGGTLPFWQGATSSQTTTTTSTTGGALLVKINLANNPTTIGSIQTITFTVLDPGGQPAPEATVHIEVTFPSGRTAVSDRQTDTNGVCTLVLQISSVPNNVGTFQVNASATKAGYETGQAEATFQAT
jgi:5-hydroxyisourate hydrolase-like protein (transthyretin family)